MAKQIGLGDIAKDTITGYEGVVIAYATYLSNCPRWTLRARETKDGLPIKAQSFDAPRVEFVGKSEIVVLPPARPRVQVGLGDKVRDLISGVKGIAITHIIYTDGCSHVAVQPQELKDGIPVDSVWIDEKDLAIDEVANPKPVAVKTGGPRPEPVR